MAILVEFCAGLGSVALRALAGIAPPVSRIGSKAGYAPALLDLFQVEIDSAYLVEADPELANAIWHLVHESAELAIRVHRTIDDDPVDLRQRSLSPPESVSPVDRAVSWFLRTASSRGGVGGFKGAHKHRPNVDGFIPSRASLAVRLAAIGDSLRNVVFVDCADCRTWGSEIADATGHVVYLDPPYEGREPIGPLLPRSDVVEVAQSWRTRGASVFVSEDEPLEIPGFESVRISRSGQARRSLTTSDEEWVTFAR